MHATGHPGETCPDTVTGPVTAMSTAFALEARRPVVVPGREIDWRLFPSGAERNEGTAIRLPSRREVLLPTPGASQSNRRNPLTLRPGDHTQASNDDPWPLTQEVPRASRPPRTRPRFCVKFPFICMNAGTRYLVVRISRRWAFYVIVSDFDRDAGASFTNPL